MEELDLSNILDEDKVEDVYQRICYQFLVVCLLKDSLEKIPYLWYFYYVKKDLGENNNMAMFSNDSRAFKFDVLREIADEAFNNELTDEKITAFCKKLIPGTSRMKRLVKICASEKMTASGESPQWRQKNDQFT